MIILIIEQDRKIAADIEDCLTSAGENSYIAYTLLEAHNLLHRYDINLILADINLFEFPAEEYKKYFCEHAYPVLLCPYNTKNPRNTENTFSGWQNFNRDFSSHGIADPDYEPLLMYLETFFNRFRNTPEFYLTAGNTVLNFKRHEAYKDGNQIFLSSRIWKLLNLFRKNPDISISMEQITECLWGTDTYNRSSCIYVYINTLRKLIEPNPHKPVVILRDGKGSYRFSPGYINAYPHRQNADVQELCCGQEVLQ